MKFNERLLMHIKYMALSILACALMIYVSELAHQARKKPRIKANVYPTINNYSPIKTVNNGI